MRYSATRKTREPRQRRRPFPSTYTTRTSARRARTPLLSFPFSPILSFRRPYTSRPHRARALYVYSSVLRTPPAKTPSRERVVASSSIREAQPTRRHRALFSRQNDDDDDESASARVYRKSVELGRPSSTRRSASSVERTNRICGCDALYTARGVSRCALAHTSPSALNQCARWKFKLAYPALPAKSF